MIAFSGMLAKDRDALLCDFAETYHIYDLRALPVQTMATLALGLRDNSRIMMVLRDQKVDMKEILLASAVDRLSYLVWLNSKDGQKGRNRPQSVLDEILGKAENTKEKIIAFSSAEDFRRAWDRCVGG